MASLIENDHVVSSLCSALLRGGSGLRNIPDLLKRTIREGMWRERRLEITGQVVRFESFPRFVEAPMPEGLGATRKVLDGICSGDEEAKTMIALAYQEKRGAPLGNRNAAKTNRIINPICFEFEDKEEEEKPQNGERSESTKRRRRLKKDHPDLLKAVHSGHLSLSAAFIQAGFAHPTVPVRLDSADSAARTLRKKATPEFLRDLCRLLSDPD